MKKRMNERLLIGVLLLGIFLVTVSVVGVADPTVDDISYNPTSPTKESTIIFTAEVSGEDISEVWLTLQECNDQICYSDKHNISMTANGDTYEAEVTLEKDDATYVKYWLEVVSDSTWYSFKDDLEELHLSTPSNGDTGNGDDGRSNQSPGFELIVLMVSIGIILFVFKRKRKK